MRGLGRLGRGLLLAAVATAAAGLSGCGDDNGGNSGGGNNTVYTLQISINPIGGGAVSRNPEKSTYTAGEQVTVTAQPSSGYNFAVWSGVSTSANSSVTVTMNANLVLTANFQQQSVTPPVGGDHVHDWGDWVVTTQATCDAPGVETRTCKIDNTHKETRAIAQLTGAGCNSTGGNDSYESVTIGGKKWMKKNLDIETADSWCYNNSADNCAKYGRLYTWAAAKSACQSIGWRLPTRDEWGALAKAAGGTGDYGYGGTAGTKLKSKSDWWYPGTDDFGFSALPGGNRDYYGNFYNAGFTGDWWTATEDRSDYAFYRAMYQDIDYVGEINTEKSLGFSVRCVQ